MFVTTLGIEPNSFRHDAIIAKTTLRTIDEQTIFRTARTVKVGYNLKRWYKAALNKEEPEHIFAKDVIFHREALKSYIVLLTYLIEGYKPVTDIYGTVNRLKKILKSVHTTLNKVDFNLRGPQLTKNIVDLVEELAVEVDTTMKSISGLLCSAVNQVHNGNEFSVVEPGFIHDFEVRLDLSPSKISSTVKPITSVKPVTSAMSGIIVNEVSLTYADGTTDKLKVNCDLNVVSTTVNTIIKKQQADKQLKIHTVNQLMKKYGLTKADL